MFETSHSVREVAHVYRGLGFAVACVFERVSVIATTALGAVAMHTSLDKQVRKKLLEETRCASAPIISHPRPNREWVFLIGPARGGRLGVHTLAQSKKRGVRILQSGERVRLSMTNHQTGWHWVSQPVTAYSLPSRTSVVSAARRLCGPARSPVLWRRAMHAIPDSVGGAAVSDSSELDTTTLFLSGEASLSANQGHHVGIPPLATMVHEFGVVYERRLAAARMHTETLVAVIARLAEAQVYACHLLMRIDPADAAAHAAWFGLAELVDGYTDLTTDPVPTARRLPALGDHR
ncbi:hypothetical protein AB0M12_15910 [Nocardia vinacea]|uniref:hypothetical protein n=1 Tax=Nocardia vinacea TaxID=96468 RepID=UPI003423E56B